MKRHAGDGLPERIEVPPLEWLAERARARAAVHVEPDVLHEDVRDAIDRSRARLPAGILADFEAGVVMLERQEIERRERVARGEREPIVVSPGMLEELVRLGWIESSPYDRPAAPIRADHPALCAAVREPGNRHDRRARRAQARRAR